MEVAHAMAEHRLERLRISLSTSSQHAQRLAEDCSRLFHKRLRTLISNVFDRVSRAHGNLTVAVPLTLDLGDLPLSDFENSFCVRLEHQLSTWLLENIKAKSPAIVKSATSSGGSNADAFVQFNRYLSQEVSSAVNIWADSNTADMRLLKAFALQPQRYLFSLATHCLRTESLQRLCQLLQAKTLLQLCQYLAPSHPVAEPITQWTLRLCALRYFQLHPHYTMPFFNGGLPTFTDDSNEHLLVTIFGSKSSPMPALATWLRALWRQQSVRALLNHELPPGVLQHLELWSITTEGQAPGAVEGQVADVAEGLIAGRADSQETTWAAGEQDLPLRANHIVAGQVSRVLDIGVEGAPEGQSEWGGHLTGERTQLTESSEGMPSTHEEKIFIGRATTGRRLNDRRIERARVPSSRKASTHQMLDEEGESLGRVVPQTPERSQAPISINNGGITLLWPLLPGLFNALGLLDGSQFLHREAQLKAICWLDELAWGDGEYAEGRMPLNKLLCELPLDRCLERKPAEDVAANAILQQWLSALAQKIPCWKRLGIADIRQLFLQRRAWLIPAEEGYRLLIQSEVYDVLLSDWPWPRNILMLPWLAQPIPLEWADTANS